MFSKIIPNLFVFEPKTFGSNAYLLVGKRNALIDSGTDANGLQKALAKLGLHPDDITLILHTHAHADHFSCDFLFKKAKIAMHSADAGAMNAENTKYTCPDFLNNKEFPKIDLILKNSQKIKLGNFNLQAIHTPGHTSGSACFYEKKHKILFSGDTLFANGFGRYDLPSGSKGQLCNSLEKLQKIDFELLLPGHGAIVEGKEQNKQNIKNALNALT